MAIHLENLFISRDNGKQIYYLEKKNPLFCHCCKKELEIIFLLSYEKYFTENIKVYCLTCHKIPLQDFKGNGQILRVRIANKSLIPLNAQRYPLTILDTRSSNNLTVLDINKLESKFTIDKTKHSKNFTSLENASIGKPINIIDQEIDKNLIVDVKNIKKFLLSYNPVIDKNNLLEAQKNE